MKGGVAGAKVAQKRPAAAVAGRRGCLAQHQRQVGGEGLPPLAERASFDQGVFTS